MRILLIDNGTGQLDALRYLCVRHELLAATPDKLAAADPQAHDAIILSGDYRQGTVWDQDYFMPETALILESGKPVLGICLGFELVCYAYGCQLHELAERQPGSTAVTPTEAGAKIFQGMDPIRVSEAPRWNIDEVPRDLVVLARSAGGIEAVKHRTKPVYGLQLYPEDFKYESDGKMVYENILDLCWKAPA